MRSNATKKEMLSRLGNTLDAAGRLAEEGYPDQSRMLIQQFNDEFEVLSGESEKTGEEAPSSISLMASIHGAEKKLEALYEKENLRSPNTRRRAFLVAILIFLFAVIPYQVWLYWRNEAFILSPQGTRVRDLRNVRDALEAYHKDHGLYPTTENKYAGLYSCWGPSSSDWVPGLQGKYIPKLPRDPRNVKDCDKQYLYRSDGRDYKLIANNPNDSVEVRAMLPHLRDPARGHAYGYWSRWGKNF